MYQAECRNSKFCVQKQRELEPDKEPHHLRVFGEELAPPLEGSVICERKERAARVV